MNFQNYNTIIKDILNNKIDNHKSIPFEKINEQYKHDGFYLSELIIIHKKYINFEELNKKFEYLPTQAFIKAVDECFIEFYYYSLYFDYVILYRNDNVRYILNNVIKDKDDFELIVTRDKHNHSIIYFRICNDILFIKSNYKERIVYTWLNKHKFIKEFLRLNNTKHLIMIGMYRLSIDLESDTIISFYTTCEKLQNGCLDNLTKLKYLIAPNCTYLYAPSHKLELIYAPKLINMFSKSALYDFYVNTLYAPMFDVNYYKSFKFKHAKNLINDNSCIDIFKSKFDYDWIVENSYMLQELKNDAKEDENVDKELKNIVDNIKDNILFNLLNNDYKNVLVCMLVEYLEQYEKIEEMNKLINNLIHLQINTIIYPVIMITEKAFKTIDN